MAVGLQLAGKNDFVKVQEDINDNLIKLDEAIDFNLLATLGIEYGGILNNTDAKVAGKAYYDTTGKKLYKCIANTNLSYADAGFFEVISNNDLLFKISQEELFSSIIDTSVANEAKEVVLNKKINRNHKFLYIQIGYTGGSNTYFPEIRRVPLTYFAIGATVRFLGTFFSLSDAVVIELKNIDDGKLSFSISRPGATFGIRNVWTANI